MNKLLLRVSLILVVLLLGGITVELLAQCPMCRMSAESNLKNGGSAGQGLNAGILYMLSVPYLLVGGVAFYWWKYKRKGIAGETDR